MNLIQKQADDFIEEYMIEHEGHKSFISNVRTELWEYKKEIHQIEFIERLIQKIKMEYD